MPGPRVEPPFYDAPIAEYPSGQRHSQAWTEYHQSVADKLQSMHDGVVDGGDAAAGDVGEYLTASGSVTCTSNVAIDIASLPLTPGDWDVRGYVGFGTSLGMLEVRAWLSVAAASPATAWGSRISLGGGTTLLASGTQCVAGPWRLSLSTPVTVYLGALARFSTGTVTAGGEIGARRAR